MIEFRKVFKNFFPSDPKTCCHAHFTLSKIIGTCRNFSCGIFIVFWENCIL